MEREGPRGLNRHRFSYEEAEQELERPVVKALHQMCRFRNRHPAFNGQVRVPRVFGNLCHDSIVKASLRLRIARRAPRVLVFLLSNTCKVGGPRDIHSSGCRLSLWVLLLNVSAPRLPRWAW